MATIPPIVSADWLRQQLREGSTDIILLDASFDAANHHGAYDNYIRENIKGSLFFDMNKCIKPRPTCARNLQEADDFREYVRSLGINNSSHLILYDTHMIYASTKTWWTFRVFGHDRVSVLNGGLINWKKQGYETVTGETAPKGAGDFDIKKNLSLAVTFDPMVEVVRNQTAQIVDCRRVENFTGSDPEPSIYTIRGLDSMGMPAPANIRSGHMKGAVNIFYQCFLDQETQLLLQKDKLKKLFSEVGVDLSKPLVSTCYMGHTASLVNMAAYICGAPVTALYYGSWTEFGQLGPSDLIN